jgi:D-beta-D-heptose 7-phosphate kinase / D-beta-D-heptose 1-phosphate adenosyltransferase
MIPLVVDSFRGSALEFDKDGPRMNDRYQTIRSGWCPPDLTYSELNSMCTEWRDRGERIVFTNGCFDVIHEGHLELFAAAVEQGERFVIGINDDAWVTRHKGEGRPLQSAAIRRAVAHCMGDADLSIIFSEETAERLLQIVKPAVYIIGSDYRGRKILGAEYCGAVNIMERLHGYSTTAIVSKVIMASVSESIRD